MLFMPAKTPLELHKFCVCVLLLVSGGRLDAFSQCDELASNGVFSKVVLLNLLELLAKCGVDTLKDLILLLLFAVVDGLKRAVSLEPSSGQRD